MRQNPPFSIYLFTRTHVKGSRSLRASECSKRRLTRHGSLLKEVTCHPDVEESRRQINGRALPKSRRMGLDGNGVPINRDSLRPRLEVYSHELQIQGRWILERLLDVHRHIDCPIYGSPPKDGWTNRKDDPAPYRGALHGSGL